MLVLSRHKDETLRVGDDVRITIVDVRGDRVRLGIDAPRSLPVHREEVYQQIQRDGRVVRGRTEEQIYGFVLKHIKHRTNHVVLITSVSERSAELQAIQLFGKGGISEKRFFGETIHENTVKAQSWAFEQWVGGAELVRAKECKPQQA